MLIFSQDSTPSFLNEFNNHASLKHTKNKPYITTYVWFKNRVRTR